MSEPRTFPMQDGPPIPWALAEAVYGVLYVPQYGQSLERLAERGGGGWDEVGVLWKRASAEDRERCVTAVRVVAPAGASTGPWHVEHPTDESWLVTNAAEEAAGVYPYFGRFKSEVEAIGVRDVLNGIAGAAAPRDAPTTGPP